MASHTVTQTVTEEQEQMEIDNPGPGPSFSSAGRDSGIEVDRETSRRPPSSPMLRIRSAQRRGSAGLSDGLQASSGDQRRNSGEMTITATVRSPVTGRRGLPGSGYAEASVTAVIKEEIKQEETVSTSLLSSSNEVKDHHNQPTHGSGEQVIGTVTISSAGDTGPIGHQGWGQQDDIKPALNIPKEPSSCRPSVISQTPIFPDPPKPQIFQIFVKNIGGKTSTYNVSKTTRVEELRRMIQETLGIPPSQQVLTYAGHNLQDGHTLEHYKIEERSTIHLTGRLRGG